MTGVVGIAGFVVVGVPDEPGEFEPLGLLLVVLLLVEPGVPLPSVVVAHAVASMPTVTNPMRRPTPIRALREREAIARMVKGTRTA